MNIGIYIGELLKNVSFTFAGPGGEKAHEEFERFAEKVDTLGVVGAKVESGDSKMEIRLLSLYWLASMPPRSLMQLAQRDE